MYVYVLVYVCSEKTNKKRSSNVFLVNRPINTVCINEPRHEKTNILHMRKQRSASQEPGFEADQLLCFRYTDSTIPKSRATF